MPSPPRKRRLSPEQSRAPRASGQQPHGVSEELLVHGHGFSRRLLAGLSPRRAYHPTKGTLPGQMVHASPSFEGKTAHVATIIASACRTVLFSALLWPHEDGLVASI
jgi:hypothetical protein